MPAGRKSPAGGPEQSDARHAKVRSAGGPRLAGREGGGGRYSSGILNRPYRTWVEFHIQLKLGWILSSIDTASSVSTVHLE